MVRPASWIACRSAIDAPSCSAAYSNQRSIVCCAMTSLPAPNALRSSVSGFLASS
jgi:hypothetical protein